MKLRQRFNTILLSNNVDIPEPLQQEINRYLLTRQSNASVDEYGAERVDSSNPYEFLIPTGWYKDEFKIDLDKRSDNKAPKKLHPLSFLELEKHGFGSISEKIIELGGPHEVGRKLGIPWQDPAREVFDENLRSKKETNYALGMRGSLTIGTSLDEKLEAAEALDLTSLKKKIAERATSDSIYESRTVDTEALEGVDYRDLKPTTNRAQISSAKGRAAAPTTIKRNEFALLPSQRLYLVAAFGSTAVAYGRASTDIVTQAIGGEVGTEIVEVVRSVCPAVLLMSVACAIGAAAAAQSKNRSPPLWGLKGLVGGPSAFNEVRLLDEVPVPTAQ